MLKILIKARCPLCLILCAGLLQEMAACQKAGAPNAVQMPVIPFDSTPARMPGTDTTHYTYLALGDSYTIGEAVPAADTYPMQTSALLRQVFPEFGNPLVLATTGWTTVNLQDAIDARRSTLDSNFSFVTLLIGVNDQYQGGTLADYRTHFTILLKESIQLAANKASHVIVLSIPDYSVTPFGISSTVSVNIANAIDSFNAANLEISQAYGVNYLNVTDDSRQAATDLSLVASDGLHYSAREYAIWAGKLAPLMGKILQTNP